MTYKELMAALESYGSERSRKIYERHGAGTNQFGVSFKDLRALHKKIKQDHGLAVKLWESGNTDARVLATMIADPLQMTEEDIDRWLSDISYYMLLDEYVYNIVVKTPFADKKELEWMKSEDEWMGRAGWGIVIHKALYNKSIEDSYFEEYLDIIEQDLQSSKNRKKESMNNALISIGLRNDELEEKAFSVAKSIGKVVIDHGKTSCKTPDAIEYINKAKKRKH